MERIQKTVFISYRRTDIFKALAVFQYLTQHGYDVFFDFDGIGSGDFERIIIENIKARAHFLVVLTPSALERCGEPADWLRREIETAIQTKRNIIPLMFDGFDFGTSSIANQLTGKLVTLKSYNALPVVAAYFTEAMSRLGEKYLNVRLETVLHPASRTAQDTAKAQRAAANATLVKQGKLIAEEEQGRIEEEKNWARREKESRRLESETQRKAEKERLRQQEREWSEEETKLKTQDQIEGHRASVRQAALEQSEGSKDDSQGAVTTTKPAFFLRIEDIFSITGRGTVVTGVVKSGTCQVGQEVAILKNGIQLRRSVVLGIEKFRKLIDTAETGDNVGILLRDVVKPGMVVISRI